MCILRLPLMGKADLDNVNSRQRRHRASSTSQDPWKYAKISNSKMPKFREVYLNNFCQILSEIQTLFRQTQFISKFRIRLC